MRFKLAGFVVAAVSLLAAQSAFATDMPAKAPVYKAPIAAATPWTGFYVNGGVGYGMWAADQTVFTTATGACLFCETQVHGGKGWLATLGVGYDYQFTSKIVAGVFGDGNLSSLKGTIDDRTGLGFVADIKQTSAWAVGARVGWLVTPKTLSYWNGGYTSARFSGSTLVAQNTGVPSAVTTGSFTTGGWFLGGGVETSVAPNWFWRTEYRYAYYDNKALLEMPQTFGNSINFKPTAQTVTTQIVYKFNGGMPAPVYPVVPAMATNWTGVYVNAGAGYGMWAADVTEFLSTTGACAVGCLEQRVGGKGYLGRAGAGYDWQFAPMWVAGVLGDFDISSLKGTIQEQAGASTGAIKQTSAWAAGARLGWLPSPQTMVYANGGYTAARFSGTTLVSIVNGAPSGRSTDAFITNGWFLGGGVETTFDFFGMFGKNWFWRNEYRYSQFANKQVPVVNAAPEVLNFKPSTQTVTSSIIFKFN